jgi:TRAP-type C4-dicarboxylate transport system substrate-binding protein
MARGIGFVCGAVMAGLALASAADAADVTLRFGSINAAGTASYDEILVPFARALEEKSGQRLAVDLKPLGGFGRPVELLPMIESGQIEIAATVQGYHPGRFPRTSVMELPLIFDSGETGSNALWSLFEEHLLGPEYDSVKVLALYVVPPYGIFTVAEQKVAGLRDLRGLRIRAPSVTVGLALARLGAIPIGLPINLIGRTLNDKQIDGIAYGWDAAYSTIGFESKTLAQQVSYMVDINFAAPTLMVVMNRKAYDGLPADLRAIIDGESGRKLAILSGRVRDQAEVKAKETIGKSAAHHVVKLGAEDRHELERRIAPVFDEWVATTQRQGIDGAALLARARALGVHS